MIDFETPMPQALGLIDKTESPQQPPQTAYQDPLPPIERIAAFTFC